MSAAVLLSAFVALTFSPMLSSKILDRHGEGNRFTRRLDAWFNVLHDYYVASLKAVLHRSKLMIGVLVGLLALCIALFQIIPSEFAPKEDRGAFSIMIKGPEGASYDYMIEHLNEIEKRLTPLRESGEFTTVLTRAPNSFSAGTFNDASATVVLSPWNSGRKPIGYYLQKVRELTSDITGVQIFPVARQALGGGSSKPIQFVLGGSSYEELVKWRDIIMNKALENPGLVGLDQDYRETRPQIGITINRDRAGDLGVPVAVINQTLESMLGSRRVTTYIDRGEEYDVILESEKDMKQSPLDITNIYVRSERTKELIPLSNLVSISEFADASTLKRYNRLRSITFEANLADGYSLGEGLGYLENLVRTELPAGAHIDYKGESQRYKDSGSSMYLVFGLALVVVFLVLAGQFESFVLPLIVMLTVPLAISGALVALWLTGQTLNIYSQIGLIILVGLAAKNGILIVEFVNQLRDEGVEFYEAIVEAAAKRLRPIIMTSFATVMGAFPLIISSGAGAETRQVIGIVIFAGVSFSTILTLFIVPVMYRLLAKNSASPEATSRRLESLLKEHDHVS
jgi:multidrug efflux pump